MNPFFKNINFFLPEKSIFLRKISKNWTNFTKISEFFEKLFSTFQNFQFYGATLYTPREMSHNSITELRNLSKIFPSYVRKNATEANCCNLFFHGTFLNYIILSLFPKLVSVGILSAHQFSKEILIKISQNFLKIFKMLVFSSPTAENFDAGFFAFPAWWKLFVKCWLSGIFLQITVNFSPKISRIFIPLPIFLFDISHFWSFW